MKKILSLLLSMTLVFSLAACSGGGATSSEGGTSEPSSQTPSESEAPSNSETPEESAEPTEETGGSGFGRSLDKLPDSAPGANILEGLHVSGSRVDGSSEEIAVWIGGLNLT